MSDSVNPTPAASYDPTTPPVAATVVAESAHIQTGGQAAPTPEANGPGIASLIVGGVALLLAFIPFINYRLRAHNRSRNALRAPTCPCMTIEEELCAGISTPRPALHH